MTDDYVFQVGFNDPEELQSKSSLRYEFENVGKSRVFTLHESVDGSRLEVGLNRVYFRVNN